MAARLLVFETDSARRIVLRALLAEARHTALWLDAPDAAVAQVAREAPELALVSLDQPGLGLELCRRLAQGRQPIPVIALSARQAPSGLRLAAIAAGAEDVIEGTPAPVEMAARIRRLLAARHEAEDLGQRGLPGHGLAEGPAQQQPPWALTLIAPPWPLAGRWLSELTRRLPARIELLSREAALGGAIARADAVLICHDPAQAGRDLTLLAELRSQPAVRRAHLCLGLPQLAIGGPGASAATVATALDLGACEVMPLGPDPSEVALRLARQIARKRGADRMRAAIDESIRQSVTDPLTALYNRRFALPELQRIAEEAHRGGSGYALILADIDRFKAVNDCHGHVVGDTVLAEIAQRLSDELGPGDLLARIGGEEFLIVLPARGAVAARAMAERLRECIARHEIRLSGGTRIAVTISLGLAVAPPGGAFASGAGLMVAADAALLRAKSGGRNRLGLASGPDQAPAEPAAGSAPAQAAAAIGAGGAPWLALPARRAGGAGAAVLAQPAPTGPLRQRGRPITPMRS